MTERELPGLASLAAALAWCEQLAVIISGPLLTGGLAIALVDLLTDGALLAHAPILLYAWAISQAVGVDAQLVGSAAKTRTAIRERRPWVIVGYVFLVAALSYVAFIAALVFATQEADGISTAHALARLGMDGTSWIVQRSAIAVGLVVLSGFLRYVPPAAEAHAEDERVKLERELDLAPLRAAVRARKAEGVREVADALRGTASARRDAQAGIPAPSPDATPATPGDSDPQPDPPAPNDPPPAPPAAADGETHAGASPVAPSLRLVAPETWHTRRGSGTRLRDNRENALQTQAFALLDADPTLSRNALRGALKCRRETASRLYAQWQRALTKRAAR